MLIKFPNTNFKEIEKMKINEYKINSDFSGNLIEIDGEHGEMKSLTEDRIYFILEGKGDFVVNGEKTEVEKNDLIFIPKNTFYDISGKMKYFLVCSPEFNAENDVFLEDKSEEKEQKIENVAFIDGQNLHYTTSEDKEDPWKVDLFKFRIYLKEKYQVEKAYYFLGVEKDIYSSLYKHIKEAGFELLFRAHHNEMEGEKKGNVDVDLIFTVMEKFYENKIKDKVVLVAGDGDYYKLANFLLQKNKFLKILFPNQKSASSLYKRFSLIYYDNLSKTDNKNKIKVK